MVVNIKSFGLLFDKLPHSIEMPLDSNLKMFKDTLMKDTDKQTADKLSQAVYLVNKAKADNETVLRDNDEVMVLTLAGGG